jgi:tetratricopeptide (TPR) repeat protein
MDFSMRKIFCLALFAALASGCGRKSTGEDAFAKGIAYYKEDKFDKAIPCFEQALASMQTNALALNFLGVCRLKEGETAAGLANLQDAVKLDPTYVPARYNLALAQLEQGQADDAVANFRQVAQGGSAPVDVHYQLGLAYMRVFAWGQAEEAFKRHLQSNPNSTDTLNCLGIVTARKREFPLSKRYFEQAIAADSKFATAYLNLASLENHQLAQKKEALAHYEMYLDLLPKSQPREDVRLAMLQINQELALATKPPARATELPAKPAKPPESPTLPTAEVAPVPKPAASPPETAVPKPVVLTPTPSITAPAVSSPPPPPAPVKKVRTPVVVKVLKPGDRAKATAYYNEGVKYPPNQSAAAIAAYTKATAADPTFAKAYYNLGIIYGNAGQTEQAMESYERALIANPNYADAHCNYGLLLQQQGYIDDAIAHYQIFLRLDPNSPSAYGIRHWLEQNH